VGREDVLYAVNWLECISGSADDGREDLSNPEVGCIGGAGSENGNKEISELEEGGKCSALW
jgi:hypothetical protein